LCEEATVTEPELEDETEACSALCEEATVTEPELEAETGAKLGVVSV